MKNGLKRLAASVVVSVLLVGIIAATGLHNGHRTDGVYYAASDIHPDAQLFTINDEVITAEEYFYWLDYVCGYLTASAGGQLDLTAPLGEDSTYADYAKMDALNTVTLRASVSSWARDNDITLTEEDEKLLDDQHTQYVEHFGGEEAFAQQLELLGVGEEQLRRVNSAPLLYNHVQEAFCDSEGVLYPGKEAIETFGKDHAFVTARLLYFATAGMDKKSAADVKDKAEDFAERLQKAKNVAKTYEKMAKELELNTNPKGLTIHPGTSDPAVCEAIAKLKTGEVSGVIQGQNGFYVAVRMPLDLDIVSVELYNSVLQERTESVKVDINRQLFEKIDAADFYARLGEARAALQKEFTDSGK